MSNRNCLSYWFPKLVEAGLPVPRTEIVKTDVDLTSLLDGVIPIGVEPFFNELRKATDAIGGCPCFLRTGQGSGKHRWKDCCFLESQKTIPQHVASLVEWSHVVDFFGLSHDVWVVRKLLPVEPLAVLPRYHGMPLVVEYRAFIGDGKVKCIHPYWPERSIRDGLECTHRSGHLVANDVCSECQKTADGLFLLTRDPADESAALSLARNTATTFSGDGEWSVDLLKTKIGWFVTDMAEAAKSYHYEGCKLT